MRSGRETIRLTGTIVGAPQTGRGQPVSALKGLNRFVC